MPFQSEKQRRYLHANHPEIAKRWERDYAGGGRIGFNSGTNYKTRKELIEEADLDEDKTLLDFLSEKTRVGSDRYNIKLSPEAEISLSKFSEGDVDVNLKNITYGADTTANIGPIEIGMDYKKFLDKYDVTEEGTTVEKDTNRDRSIAYMLGLNLEDLYAKIEGDKDFKNFYFTIRKTFSGGGTPAHEAGIYGLAEGGRTDYIHGGITYPSGRRGFPGGAGTPGGYDAPAPSSSGGDGYQSVHDTGAITQTPGRTTTTTTTTGDGYQDRIIELQDRQRRQDLKDIITRGDEEKYDNPLDKYSYTPQGTINRENFKQKQALDNWNAVKDTANTWAKKKAGKLLVDQLLLGGATFGLSDVIGGIVQGFKTNKAKNEFINTIKGSIGEYQKLGFAEHSPHEDTLIQDLNQQLLDLTQTTDRPDEGPDGGDGVTGVASITYDDIEDKNKKERASVQWRQEQEKVDRSKQMAYWRMMMQPYMSAQGGRVPGGYNTGGLSNLFRLKNV